MLLFRTLFWLGVRYCSPSTTTCNYRVPPKKQTHKTTTKTKEKKKPKKAREGQQAFVLHARLLAIACRVVSGACCCVPACFAVCQAVETLRDLLCTGNSFVAAQACFRLRTLRRLVTAHQARAGGGGTLSGRVQEELVDLYRALDDKARLDAVRERRKQQLQQSREGGSMSGAAVTQDPLRRLPPNSFSASFAKLHRLCQSRRFVSVCRHCCADCRNW